MKPLTRKEFYEIAIECRERALDLARYDQDRVNLAQCRRFNDWFQELQDYEPLADTLSPIQAARPINRWMVMGGAFGIWALGMALLGQQFGVVWGQALSLGLMGTLIILLFVPERIYGTTIQMIEAKTLLVVEALEDLLLSGEMGFTEAAFFQVKENLEIARKELRQQIHLANRW
jgi:hypothetical protein